MQGPLLATPLDQLHVLNLIHLVFQLQKFLRRGIGRDPTFENYCHKEILLDETTFQLAIQKGRS